MSYVVFPETQESYINPHQPLEKKQVLCTLESTHGSSFRAPMSVPIGELFGVPFGSPKWVRKVDIDVYIIVDRNGSNAATAMHAQTMEPVIAHRPHGLGGYRS